MLARDREGGTGALGQLHYITLLFARGGLCVCVAGFGRGRGPFERLFGHIYMRFV